MKSNLYLKDIKNFQQMYHVFVEVFPAEPAARTRLQTPLAEASMLVEVEAIAYIGE